jgi:hypothetical protein
MMFHVVNGGGVPFVSSDKIITIRVRIRIMVIVFNHGCCDVRRNTNITTYLKKEIAKFGVMYFSSPGDDVDEGGYVANEFRRKS